MNKDNVKLAIAPIGWTNDDMPELGSENTFQQIVSEMALSGTSVPRFRVIKLRDCHASQKKFGV